MTADVRQDALLVVHDVWGRTPALVAGAERVASALGARPVVPDHLGTPVTTGATNAEAYASFMADVGVERLASLVADDASRLRGAHRRVLALGFSVGATAVWLAAAEGAVDAAVCVYGSRIRDHAATPPVVPCLALFAERERAFDVHDLVRTIGRHPTVEADVVGGAHGFCNPAEDAYDAALADQVERRATAALRAVVAEGAVSPRPPSR